MSGWGGGWGGAGGAGLDVTAFSSVGADRRFSVQLSSAAGLVVVYRKNGRVVAVDVRETALTDHIVQVPSSVPYGSEHEVLLVPMGTPILTNATAVVVARFDTGILFDTGVVFGP